MPWSEHPDDKKSGQTVRSRRKVCSVCGKIIIRKDDLHEAKGVVTCGKCHGKSDN